MTVSPRLKLIYFNVSLFCALLVGLELAGQAAYFLLKGYPLHDRDRHLIAKLDENPFEVHPFTAGRLKSNLSVQQSGKLLRTTESHTRWTGANTNNDASIRVALLGGSTTFGSGVTDAETWASQLQSILGPRYAVTNHGVPGYSSAEAIVQLALVVPEERPDIVVLYEGWNDIHNYHEPGLGADYYTHGLKQYSNLAIQRPRPTGVLVKLAEISTICRLAMTLSKKLATKDGAVGASDNPAYPVPDPIGNANPDPFVDRLYLRNLVTLKALGRQQGAFVLFVPQVLDYSRFKGTSGSWWTPHVQNDAMPRLLDRFNLFMNSACPDGESGCAVLSDVTRQAWTPDDFIDEGHFSAKGNLAFARFLAPHVQAIGRRIPKPVGHGTIVARARR